MSAWKVTPKEAVQIQHRLRSRVRERPLPKRIRYVAGCDVSANMFSYDIHAGFVVLSYPELKVVDHAVVRETTAFPYIPGLLSFREIPTLLKAWKKLRVRPDIILVDGQGIAHPRRFGIAAHLGVALGVPTIGCAKSILVGTHKKVRNVGKSEPLVDPKTNEIIGAALLSKKRSNPIIISVGHKANLTEAVAFVSSCLAGYRLPEPTRQAHLAVNAYRKRANANAHSPQAYSRGSGPRRRLS